MQTESGIKFRGLFHAECYRWHDENGNRFRDAKGRFERRLMWEEEFSNLIVNEGLNHMLDVTLHGKTLIDPFYCVLFESDTTILATHDYAAPGYTEVNAAIDEATRPEYNEAAASGQSITNSANKATFTFNASKTIYGAALVGGSSTKGDTTDDGAHVELCAAKFGSSRAVVDDDVINLTYTVTAADDGV